MFTGLIESLGTVVRLESHSTGARLEIAAPAILPDTRLGDSICVNGVCLTAIDPTPQTFQADLAPETLARTNLGALTPGSLVNLERSLAAGARLGGHILQGHVDGVGVITAINNLGEGNWWLQVQVPAELERYIVYKGSIAIDGISLTVARVDGREVGITIIPHTWTHTNLHQRAPGATVNLETDILAKYVEKMMANLVIPKQGV
jgi:riboflavin synthase